MPDIIAFYEFEEGKKIFEEWKAKRLAGSEEDNKASKYEAAESSFSCSQRLRYRLIHNFMI